MIKYIGNFRILSWIAILCSLAGSLLMFIIGALKTYYAFSVVFIGNESKESVIHLTTADIATKYLIKSLDAFLIALVLFIFAYGVHFLFLTSEKDKSNREFLNWINIPNISYLKNVLAEVIIIILFVKFLEIVFTSIEKLSWEALVLPVSILLLSIGLKFLDLRHEPKCADNKEI
jgi:uncharacterized membrane protein YqhA